MKTMEERFWEKVSKNEGCWEWQGGRHKRGYGKFHVDLTGDRRRWSLAHRVSWELAHELIPPGSFVLHKCDTPACVRPDHLELGDQKKNMGDCALRGRRPDQKGEHNGCAKLTEAKVRDIRTKHDGRYGSISRLAREFGVSWTVVSDILARKAWGCVT